VGSAETRHPTVAVGDAAITLQEDALILKFPAGRFRDVLVDGLLSSPRNSHAGQTRVRFWTTAEISRYYDQRDRWHRYGRHVVKVVTWAGRSPSDDGLVQRVARHVDVPLGLPADRSALVSNCMVIGR
jgi:hypothetical protein